MFLTKRAMLMGGASLVATGLVSVAPAFAQRSPEENDSNIIIVTAQNRAENVQDVPIAMDVVGQEKISQAGFSNASDLGKISPSVQINEDQGQVKITVRGVGTTSIDEAQDTSVVANVDGEYINRPNAFSVALFDLERVEVLRGPQGTLYGRNSTGGAVNFITRKPGKEFGVNATASYGNYNAIRLDAGVDMPIGNMAGVRVAGFYDDRDGYVKHPAGGGFFVFPAYDAGRSDDNKSYGGRLSLRFDPTDALSINLAGEYAERHFRPAIFAAGDLNAPGNGPTGPGCNAAGFETVAPDYGLTLCVPSSTNLLSQIDRGEYDAPFYGLGSGLDQKTWALRGRVAYEFAPEATLTYIGGYRNFKQGDPSGNEYLTLPVVYRSYQFQDDAKTQSHELRLNGTIGGVIYQVGGFYFKEKLVRESGFLLPTFIFGGSPADPATFLSYFRRLVDSESASAFGQVEVPLADTLTAVGGLRYTHNKRSALYLNAAPFGNGPPDPALLGAGPDRKNFADLAYVQTLDLGSRESKVTWLAGLNWKPDPMTLVYAKATTGFKGGGFDSVGTYKPETNTAYEVGLKKNFGDRGQHQFNLSGFYYDYKDLQVSVLLDTNVGNQIFNAGKATIWGVEAEAAIELSENDHFNASFNYLNSQYDELFAQFNVVCVGCDLNGIGDLDPNTPGVQQPDFAGNTTPFSPKFIITMAYDHVFDLGSAGKVTARMDTLFKSAYYTDFYNYRDGKQRAFTQSGASLEYKPENGRFSVTAFVRNIENKRPLTYGSFVSAGPDDIFNWQFGAPRTYGIRVGADF
ncbi:TonB-dependent receptor (plasmid) [Novosphingobium sp. PP1Y]|nr:TonB-dependent receptor [Novosphingobium sp. PP1Y]